jgi:hypothetical protein
MTAATVQAGLVSVLATALAGDTAVQVTAGTPGPTVVPDIIAVGRDIQTAQDGEEQTYAVDLIVSCYVGGGAEAQPLATTRAYSLLASCHTAINAAPTLLGSCRVAALDFDHRNAETIAYDATGQTGVGRLAEIQATVMVWAGRPTLGSLLSAHIIP